MSRQARAGHPANGNHTRAHAVVSPEQFESEIKFWAAVKLYEVCRITSGEAAPFCRMERAGFVRPLSRLGMAVSDLRPDDSEAELDFAYRGQRAPDPA